MAGESVIRAAGVVLLRSEQGQLEFAVIHRPGRKDWSLPKGKLDAGEHVLVAAVRECDEETGYSPVLGVPLPAQSYSVAGRPKVVSYWRARIREEAGFAPDDEVDEVRWLPPDEAAATLTYASEVKLVEAATAAPDTVPLIIVRHTQALKRSKYDGKHDHERPLSGKGRSQSKSLVTLLDAFGVDEVRSSPAVRCADTVGRLAKHLDRQVLLEPTMSEEGHEQDPGACATRAAELAQDPTATVLCTHRPVLPTALEAMISTLGGMPSDRRDREALEPRLSPGSFIVLHRAFDADGTARLVAAERHNLS
jgi:phosphohistidine phosphatase SixA/8-oxo-dGTP pyrophosphatase MutT (NUDIX family)